MNSAMYQDVSAPNLVASAMTFRFVRPKNQIQFQINWKVVKEIKYFTITISGRKKAFGLNCRGKFTCTNLRKQRSLKYFAWRSGSRSCYNCPKSCQTMQEKTPSCYSFLNRHHTTINHTSNLNKTVQCFCRIEFKMLLIAFYCFYSGAHCICQLPLHNICISLV